MRAWVVHGVIDEPDEAAHRSFPDRIPDARGQIFPGADHTSFSDSPAQLREVLGAFLPHT